MIFILFTFFCIQKPSITNVIIQSIISFIGYIVNKYADDRVGARSGQARPLQYVLYYLLNRPRLDASSNV